MAFRIDNDNRTFKLKHVGAIIAVAVFLLALNWFKSGFLLSGKPLQNNPIDITASNQAYKEWQILNNQPGEEPIALVTPAPTAVAAAPNDASGQVLGDTDPIPVEDKGAVSHIMNNFALPLLTGKFTSSEVSTVSDEVQKALN